MDKLGWSKRNCEGVGVIIEGTDSEISLPKFTASLYHLLAV